MGEAGGERIQVSSYGRKELAGIPLSGLPRLHEVGPNNLEQVKRLSPVRSVLTKSVAWSW